MTEHHDRSAATEQWPPLKMALWRVLMDERLNDGHYIKAFDLIEKLYSAARSVDAAQQAPVTENDLYYLRSIQRQLETVKESLDDITSFSIGGLAFADNVNWLDCFIDAHERALASQPPAAPVETETRFHTDLDREYARSLIDDLDDQEINASDSRMNIVTQWLCKVRVETARRCAAKSAPALGPSQNTAERLPSSDAAEAGADTRSSAETEEIAEARRLEIGEGIFIAAWEIEDIRKIGVLSTRVDVPMGARMQCHCCLKWTSTYYMRLTCWICPDCEQLVTGKTMSRLGVDAMTASAETEGLLAEFFSHSAIDEAMQDAWNDICTDTGCHPLDIEHGRGKHLTFKPSHWANQIAKRLFLRAVKVQLKADAEIGNHLPDLPQAAPQRDPIVAAVASLAAAISLLERTPKAKKAAPSDKMFDQMLADYRKALADARSALAVTRPKL